MPDFKIFVLLFFMLVAAPAYGAQTAATPDPTALDRARTDVEIGRFWQADQTLSPLLAAGELDANARLVLGRARAGHGDWQGALSAIEGIASDSSPASAAVQAQVWILEGRIFEELGQYERAVQAYGQALSTSPRDARRAALIEVRLARAWARLGDMQASLATLDSLARHDAFVSMWASFELLNETRERADTAWARALVDRLGDTDLSAEAQALQNEIVREAGDTLAAGLWWSTAPAEVRETFGVQRYLAEGDAARLTGDLARACTSYEAVLQASPRSASAAVAARYLMDGGCVGQRDWLAMARAFDRVGDGRRALTSYDRYVAVIDSQRSHSDAGGVGTDSPEQARARVERARLMATVPERQQAAIAEWRELSQHPDSEVGVRALELWRGLRRRQGRDDDAATLRQWLLERYPDSEVAARARFLSGDLAHDRGEHERALRQWSELTRSAPGRNAAGQARMRAAQLHLTLTDTAQAIAEFEAYLTQFPTGRRWEEAAYWAARLHRGQGLGERAQELLGRLADEAPVSYYTVLAARLEGRDYTLRLPAGPAAPAPAWLIEDLGRLDRLQAAGLTRAVERQIRSLIKRAEGDGISVILPLAEGLIDRGRTLEAINLGWAAREAGAPWSMRLARVLYPLPYREMIEQTAQSRGLDPWLLVALIRQESAFVRDIRSPAGAIGLMQVMPSTGQEVARQVGLNAFSERSLETPDINLHLGSRFLFDMIERFDEDLPLVLSAYNAGPTRANRWAKFAEAVDPERFTERIPFDETRGYVKNVTRNYYLYRALWADVAPSARTMSRWVDPLLMLSLNLP
jgi:soluble lytic murein transglycosylase